MTKGCVGDLCLGQQGMTCSWVCLNQINGKVKHYFADEIPLYTAFYINDLKFDKAGRLFVAHRGGVDILYPNQNIIKKIPSVTNREFKPELQAELINLINSSQPIASILKVGEQKLLEDEFEFKGTIEGSYRDVRFFSILWIL